MESGHGFDQAVSVPSFQFTDCSAADSGLGERPILLEREMKILLLFETELKSLVLTLVTAGLLYLFRARVKLIWAIPHGFTFLLQGVAPKSENESSSG